LGHPLPQIRKTFGRKNTQSSSVVSIAVQIRAPTGCFSGGTQDTKGFVCALWLIVDFHGTTRGRGGGVCVSNPRAFGCSRPPPFTRGVPTPMEGRLLAAYAGRKVKANGKFNPLAGHADNFRTEDGYVLKALPSGGRLEGKFRCNLLAAHMTLEDEVLLPPLDFLDHVWASVLITCISEKARRTYYCTQAPMGLSSNVNQVKRFEVYDFCNRKN